MAAGIMAKADTAVMQAELVELHARIAERDEQLAFMVDKVAALEAGQVSSVQKAGTVAAPAPAAPLPDPEAEFNALAILAAEGKVQASRTFWLAALDRLGRLLLPGQTPADQRMAALHDPRGRDLLRAIQAAP